jgi:[CysO sulfur-carrier protein]-S-L-cysteine hydrolase
MTSMSLPSPAHGAPIHPGPISVELSADLVQAIVDHARADYPNEACGVIVGDRDPALGGSARRFVPMGNIMASPFRYQIDPLELLRLDDQLEAVGEAYWAIVHSHVRSAAYPSPTDVRQAGIYTQPLYVLVSLEADEPALGAFRIVDGTIFPVELLVGAGG